VEACDQSRRIIRCAISVSKKEKTVVNYRVGSIYKLPYKDKAFDLVMACEVLEHLSKSGRALKEIKRVAKKNVIITVPNEPLWRLANIARLKYLKSLGNSPGHLQNWTYHQLKKLLEQHFREVRIKNVLIWNIAVCKV
jgi:ubiquinone/menaquinone biosynthesis C-methylase UbiE